MHQIQVQANAISMSHKRDELLLKALAVIHMGEVEDRKNLFLVGILQPLRKLETGASSGLVIKYHVFAPVQQVRSVPQLARLRRSAVKPSASSMGPHNPIVELEKRVH